MWAENYVSDMGHHITSDYGLGVYEASKQLIIDQRHPGYKILILQVRNLLTTYVKCNLSTFKTYYDLNSQNNLAEMFFLIVKILHLDTLAGFSYIKTKL